MSLSLYEIDDKYKTVLAELEAMDDIPKECIDDTMAQFKDDLEKKCLAVGAFIKNLDAEASAVKDAKDNLAARQKAVEAKAKRMREYLAAHLPGKLKDAQVTLTPLKGRESIVVDDVQLLPEGCYKVELKAISAEVKKNFDQLPEGAAHKVIGNASVMVK